MAKPAEGGYSRERAGKLFKTDIYIEQKYCTRVFSMVGNILKRQTIVSGRSVRFLTSNLQSDFLSLTCWLEVTKNIDRGRLLVLGIYFSNPSFSTTSDTRRFPVIIYFISFLHATNIIFDSKKNSALCSSCFQIRTQIMIFRFKCTSFAQGRVAMFTHPADPMLMIQHWDHI